MASLSAQANTNLGLLNPEKIDSNHPAGVAWTEAARFSEDRLKTIQNIQQTLKEKEAQYRNEDRQNVQDTLKFLENFSKSNQDYIRREEENINRHRQEALSHSQNFESAKRTVDNLRNEVAQAEAAVAAHDQKDAELLTIKQGIQRDLQPADIAKLKFSKNDSLGNDTFKWFTEVLYQEPVDSYTWDKFKKRLSGKDKGADFTERLGNTSLKNLSDAHFDLAHRITQNRQAHALDMDPKQKRPSVVHALDYIRLASEIGTLKQQSEADRAALAAKKQALEDHLATLNGLSGNTTNYENQVKDTEHYVSTLRSLQPQIDTFAERARQRARAQEQEALQAQNRNDAEVHVQGQTQSPNKRTNVQAGASASPQKQSGNQYQSNAAAGFTAGQAHEEEDFFAGEGNAEAGHGRKVESKPTPATDLRESEFANSKKGSCESCNMF